MSHEFIHHASMTGSEVAAVAQKIALAVEGDRNDVIVAACIAISLMVQRPDITSDDLEECVLEVSQYIAMVLSEGLLGIDPDKPMN